MDSIKMMNCSLLNGMNFSTFKKPLLARRARAVVFSPQNRAIGLSVFGNHTVVAKSVDAARASYLSHRTARFKRFKNDPLMTYDKGLFKKLLLRLSLLRFIFPYELLLCVLISSMQTFKTFKNS